MTVNVSLCGSIPRSELMSCSSHQPQLNGAKHALTLPPLPSSHTTADVIALAASTLTRKVSGDSVVSSSQVIEPPSWAVPARGEAMLEPVCESRRLQRPIDLTSKAVFRVGRSDTSDVQLFHCASSRRHAILFHHPNGSCYVVDCGSAHGTYINGNKVKSSITSHGVVPQRVKKGALIRFGGVGAPSYILKSFSVGLDSLVRNLEETKSVVISSRTNIIEDEQQTSTLQANSDYCLDALVTLNTRLNSVGNVSSLSYGNDAHSLAAAQLRSHLRSSLGSSLLRKRSSTVSFDDNDQDDDDSHKKLKLSSSTESTDSNDSIGISFVSPSRQKPMLQFDFSHANRPVVSPNPFEDINCTFTLGPGIEKSILKSPFPLDLSSKKKKKKSVSFDTSTQVFYPPTVTPESSSDDEEL